MNEDKDIDVGNDLRQAYADLSTEVTPPALDAKILDAARPNSRLSNLLALKPLSWAAITVLSIGLVLELQRSTPEPDAVMAAPEPNLPTDSVDTRFERQAVGQDQNAAKITESANGYAAEMPIAAPVNRSMQNAREVSSEIETLDRAPVQPAAQLFEDRDDLQVVPEAERFCEPSETVDAGSWYRCVLRLREEERDEQAAFELSLLKSRFPDFEVR